MGVLIFFLWGSKFEIWYYHTYVQILKRPEKNLKITSLYLSFSDFNRKTRNRKPITSLVKTVEQPDPKTELLTNSPVKGKKGRFRLKWNTLYTKSSTQNSLKAKGYVFFYGALIYFPLLLLTPWRKILRFCLPRGRKKAFTKIEN